MTWILLWKRLLPLDWKTIRRDSLLLWVPLFPFVLALFLRQALPALNGLLATWQFSLAPYYSLFLCGLLLLVPQMSGLLVGFLLLDERDERTLQAIQMTPVPTSTYLLYKLSLPLMLGFVSTLLSLPLSGFVTLRWWQALLVVPICALLGPITALFLVAFADNKVTGLAVFKLMNGVLMLPLVAFFVAEPWQWLFGLLPPYWTMKAVWMMQKGEAVHWVLLVGWLTHGLAAYGLYRLWSSRLERG